jgi:hypothetical protein
MVHPDSPMSAVVPCKGRLARLKHTLPLLLDLPLREVVVVDYDCPEGTGDWVESAFPAAKLVRAKDRPFFNASMARNLGARATSAPWLFFVDVDTRVAPGFWDAILGQLAPGAFVIAEPRELELWGTFVTSRADFDALGGFDETFEGWGGEDTDFIERLEALGRSALTFDSCLTVPIPHTNEMRMRHHKTGDSQLSGLVNDIYRTIKNDLARQGVALDEAGRRHLYAQVRQGLEAGKLARSYEVHFREIPMHGHALTATLKYELKALGP